MSVCKRFHKEEYNHLKKERKKGLYIFNKIWLKEKFKLTSQCRFLYIRMRKEH